MVVYSSLAGPYQPPQDDLSLTQYFLDGYAKHPTVLPRDPSIPCMIDENTGAKVYFDQLRARTDALASALHVKYNFVSGQKAMIISPNHLDYPVCVWAVHRNGGVVVPANPGMTVDEIAYQLGVVKPSILIANKDIMSLAIKASATISLPTSALIQIDGDIPSGRTIESLISEGYSLPLVKEQKLSVGEAKKKWAFLCFSSGTTGQPKAVIITHYNLISDVVQMSSFYRIHEDYASEKDKRFRPGDVCTGVLPLYHIYGLVVNLHFVLYAQMTTVVSQRFNFEQFLASIQRYRITHLMIVPPQAVLLCKHPAVKQSDLSSVRYCMVAAAPLTAETADQLLNVLPPGVHLGQGYGMTETTAAVSMFPLSQRVGTLGSGGQLISGTIAKIVRQDGSLAGVGQPGELLVKGGQIVPGYYNDVKATEAGFTYDGWCRTGDEAFFEENGDIYIIDRIKEMIKVKGHGVAPAELEGHLLNHPLVADAGVVGIPDDFAGELPLAFVTLVPGLLEKVQSDPEKAAEIKRSIAEHVEKAKSKYKWLAGGIRFIDAIPKSPSGKILRRVLREQATPPKGGTTISSKL